MKARDYSTVVRLLYKEGITIEILRLFDYKEIVLLSKNKEMREHLYKNESLRKYVRERLMGQGDDSFDEAERRKKSKEDFFKIPRR